MMITRYLSATGNDANDGLTALTPWLTPQHALDCVKGITLGGDYAEICMADGTYTGPVYMNNPPCGGQNDKQAIRFVGNNMQQRAVIITGTNGVVSGGFNCTLYFEYVWFQNAANSLTDTIYVDSGGVFQFYGCCFSGTTNGAIWRQAGGQIMLQGPTGITSGGYIGALAQGPGKIDFNSAVVSVDQPPPTFSGAFAVSDNSRVAVINSTFSGAAIGNRAFAKNNGVIDMGGLGISGFPGSTNVSGANGGIIVS